MLQPNVKIYWFFFFFLRMKSLKNPASFYRPCSDNLIGIFSLEHVFTDKKALGTSLHHEAKYVTIVLLVVL